MIPDEERTSRILALLREHPEGLSISDMAHRLHANRNSLAKYLDLLLLTGRVEVQVLGTARVFSAARRVPLPVILGSPRGFVMVLDPDGRVVQVNDPYLKFFGLSRAAVEGVCIESSSLPLVSEIPPGLLSRMSPQYDGGVVREQLFTREDREYWFQVTCTPVVLEEGTPGLLITIDDVSVEHHKEIALAQSEARYHALADEETDLICRFLPDRRLTFVNRAWCLFFGRHPGHENGRSVTDSFTPEDRETFSGLIDSCTREEPVVHGDLRSISATGETRWLHWSFRLLHHPEGPCLEFQAVGRDITDQVGAESASQGYMDLS